MRSGTKGKKLNAKNLKWLKLLHILSISIWFGGAACIGVLILLCFHQPNESNFYAALPLIPQLYSKLILPFALLTLIQGLIYGFFSHWGFIKHKWILYKWILALLIIPCTSAIISRIIEITQLQHAAGTLSFEALAAGNNILLLVCLQMLFLLIILILSIFKPFKLKSANNQAADSISE